ncbi:MAG: hypothetical protein EON55_09110, partial [Alphaproteobacteria bacterium]
MDGANRLGASDESSDQSRPAMAGTEALQRPGLLLLNEGSERMLGGALSDRFELIRLWNTINPDGLLAARGPDVAAILTSRLDAALLKRLLNLRLVVVPGAG